MGCKISKSIKVDAQRENSILAADIAAEAASAMVHAQEGGDSLMVLPNRSLKTSKRSASGVLGGGLPPPGPARSLSGSESGSFGGGLGSLGSKLERKMSEDSTKAHTTLEGAALTVDRSLTGGSTVTMMPEGRPAANFGSFQTQNSQQTSRSHPSQNSIELESFHESFREKNGRLQTMSPKPARPLTKGLYPSGSGNSRPGEISWKRGELIGAGASGRVFMALEETTGQLMAVKELMCTADLSEQDLLAIKNEIELMRSIRHPNIVQYLGTDVVDNTLLIFTEWVPGGSLLALQKKFGKLSETIIKNYTRQILMGLAYLHQQQVVHRDIKAANILVDDRGTIKLADFGSSKRLVGTDGVLNAGSLKGTPYFMAPEVIAQQNHGPKADIWAVACTIIHMVSGEHPWQSLNLGTPHAIMYHIVNTNKSPPLPSGISDSLRDFLLACFKRDVNERPSAEELLKHPFLRRESSSSPIAAAVTYDQFLVTENATEAPANPTNGKTEESIVQDPSVNSLYSESDNESPDKVASEVSTSQRSSSGLPPAHQRRRLLSKDFPLKEEDGDPRKWSDSSQPTSSRKSSSRKSTSRRKKEKDGGDSFDVQSEMSVGRHTAEKHCQRQKKSRRRPRSHRSTGGMSYQPPLPSIQRPGTFRSVNEYLQTQASHSRTQSLQLQGEGGVVPSPTGANSLHFGEMLDKQTSEWVSLEASPFDLGATSGRFEGLEKNTFLELQDPNLPSDQPCPPSHHPLAVDPQTLPTYFGQGSSTGSPLVARKTSSHSSSRRSRRTYSNPLSAGTGSPESDRKGSDTRKGKMEPYGFTNSYDSAANSPATDRKSSGNSSRRSARGEYKHLPSRSELRPSNEDQFGPLSPVGFDQRGYSNSPHPSTERLSSSHSNMERLSSAQSVHDNRPIITARAMKEREDLAREAQASQQRHLQKRLQNEQWEEELKRELEYQQSQKSSLRPTTSSKNRS